jgi:hypothetical protein
VAVVPASSWGLVGSARGKMRVQLSHTGRMLQNDPLSFRKRPQAVGELKRFKRIALRCEKTAQNYGSFLHPLIAHSDPVAKAS